MPAAPLCIGGESAECAEHRRRIRDVRAADLQTNRASAASTSPSGELCAGGDDGTTLFRSVSSDEDGGNPANIAASGSEQSNSGARAAVLRRREPTRFSSASDDKVGGFPARSAASEASNQTQRDARAAAK
jgi:hypothetical protein